MSQGGDDERLAGSQPGCLGKFRRSFLKPDYNTTECISPIKVSISYRTKGMMGLDTCLGEF